MDRMMNLSCLGRLLFSLLLASSPAIYSPWVLAAASDDATNQNNNDNDKAYKICTMSGGLDVTRLVSSTTRNFFQSALEDVELIREVIGESAMNGGLGSRNTKPQASAEEDGYFENDLDRLAHTLDWEARNEAYGTNWTADDTTVTAGLGYVDDGKERRIERYVSTSSNNQPVVGNKESDLGIIEAAANIFPWIVDRRSSHDKWWISHQNGELLGHNSGDNDDAKDTNNNAFDQLYTAAWIGTKGEAWLYYPPVLLYGHPLNFGDILGPQYESHEEEFVEPNFPENNPQRISYFTKPYPDTAVPGLSLITAQAPLYFTGTFDGYDYQDTYIASTGVDIAVSAISSYLDVLQDKLTPGSFGTLVDASDFTSIVISQHVVHKLFPTTTGSEDSRVTYDAEKNIVQDRRHQPYLPSDTILQPLVNFTNANWTGLRNHVMGDVSRGQRDLYALNITLTGDATATEFYVLSDRWDFVADWVLLVFVPVTELDKAIDVRLAAVGGPDKEGATTTLPASSLGLEGVQGDTLYGNFSIANKGNLDVLVSSKSLPSWVQLADNGILDRTLLAAGEELAVPLYIDTSEIHVGTKSLPTIPTACTGKI